MNIKYSLLSYCLVLLYLVCYPSGMSDMQITNINSSLKTLSILLDIYVIYVKDVARNLERTFQYL